jgi:hypothetical protein
MKAKDFRFGPFASIFLSRKRKKKERKKEKEKEAFAAGQGQRQREAGLAQRTLLQTSTPGSAQQRTLLGG